MAIATPQKTPTPKEKWYERFPIVPATTDNGSMYYLLDENYDFIPFVKQYLEMIQARSDREISPNTIQAYCYDFRYFIIFLSMKGLGILDLDGKPDVLAKFKLWLKNPYRFYENVELINYDFLDFEYKADELETSTINRIISQVSALYNWLKASNKIKDNPVVYRSVAITLAMKDKDMLAHTRRSRTAQVNTLKSTEPRKKPKTTEPNDFKKILDAVKLLRDKIILLVLKEGGLRAGELLGIRIEDIDYAEQGIWVKYRPNNSNKSRAKAGYGRDRFVHLPHDLMVLIDRYISSDWCEIDPDEDYLFVVTNSNTPSDNGKGMKKSTLDSMFKHYTQKTKVKLHPHMLRHTHVTELARGYISKEEPINWKYISERIGHSSVTTTMEFYAHLMPEDHKKEYQRMHKYRESKRKERNH